MPEVYRALIVILFLNGVTFVALRKPILAMGMAPADYARRRDCWIAMTVLGIASPSFWIAMAAVAIVAMVGRTRERNPVALYAMLLLALPLLSKEIPGVGPIQHFVRVDHSRVLALMLLVPAALSAASSRALPRPGRLLADKAVLAFFGLVLMLQITVGTPLGILRAGVVYPMLDALLLYFVASRTLVDPARFDDFKATLVLASALLVPVAVFEFGKGWLLFAALSAHLGATWDMGAYLMRNDLFLRAVATAGQPIALGYLFMIGLVFTISAARALPRAQRLMLIAILVAGSIAPLSRGPWIGAAAAVLTYIALGRDGAKGFITALAVTGAIGLALSSTPQGRAVLDYLPFVGQVESGNVTYRQQVVDVSMQVIMDKPFFGAYDALNDPRMEQLRQGQGIIDIVNTYIGVALGGGFVGLSLFCAAFVIPLAALVATFRRHSASESIRLERARTLFAALVGVLVTLGTTSSITIIPHLYWLLVGAAVAAAMRVRSPIRSFGPIEPAATVSRDAA